MKKIIYLLLILFAASCNKEDKEQKEFEEMIRIAQQFANDSELPNPNGFQIDTSKVVKH